jgi:AraC family transcriptional regulator of arabinose operon
MALARDKAMFWNHAIADMRVDVSMAAYTKVPVTWKEFDYTPDFNKLYFIVEGSGSIRVGDAEYAPRPGQLVLMPHGVKQSYTTVDGKETFGKHWCHFTAFVGDDPLFRVVDVPLCVDVPEAERALLALAFERLAHWHKREELTGAVRVRGALLDILATYMESGSYVRVKTGHTEAMDKMNRVLRHIEEHLSEQLSVEELAELAHFHPNYFHRLFKRTTGQTPIQYVNRQRIERAKKLFAATELNVSAVADHFGLEVSYFSRMFKEYTGFTPSQYREFLS